MIIRFLSHSRAGVGVLLVLSTRGRFSSHHRVERCVVRFWERTSAFSCAFTFEMVSFSVTPHGTLSCLALIIVV